MTSQEADLTLRQELKSWEQAFLSKHGRKPSREDIKSEPSIADKYKQFNRAKRPVSNAGEVPTTPRKQTKAPAEFRKPLQDKSVNVQISTPHKLKSTPRKVAEPEPIEATPLHIRCALGPTPQKDGHVLGLFDCLPGLGLQQSPAQDLDGEGAISSTPNATQHGQKHSRTPRSSSKRFYLEAFAGTPLKRKREEGDIGTPGTVKRFDATPAFLRRDLSFDTACQDDAGKGRRKKGFVRSLSTIIAGLKKNEEDRMDDEWEIMRELEAEEEDDGDESSVQVKDSQAPDAGFSQDMPLGPDMPANGEEDSDSSADKETGRKPWRKKGLKRQTKRTNMKPVLHAPRKADEAEQPSADAEVGDKEPGVIKKALKKVNEAAHMNFRKLKIKNKNSKANGRGGRFGRR